MISEVPTLAIEKVDFQDNSSALFDETIAHRLGLMPLKFNPDKFNLPGECRCKGKGCPLCQVVFALEKTGPVTVYSGDMKSSNRSVKPTSQSFPIVKLLKDQHIELKAFAEMDIGKEHMKWQAANVSYQYLPKIEVEKGFKDLKKIVKSCSKRVLGVKNRKLVLLDPFKCDGCRVCEEIPNSGVKIKSDPTKFVFKVESVSGLDPQYIIFQGVRILQEKVKEFKKELKNIK